MEVKLGQLITEEAGRDAVHVAVAPVIANERLQPGQDIGLVEGQEVVGVVDDPIGIVDPFLKNPVVKGQRFWLFLYPNTITSLRHEWTHQSFSTESRDVSESWLRLYAVRMNDYMSEDGAFGQLLDGLRSGHIHSSGTDLHGFYDLDNPDELRYHAENYLGIRIDWGDFTFSCSC